jgi:chromosome segregation ATPase
MRKHLIILGLFAVAFTTAAHGEDSELDRLRQALRDATAQLHGLDDQRLALQNQLNAGIQERDRLKSDVAAAKARIKAVEKAHREAVAEFNQRLEERNQVLEKWKAAYEEAATVARTKDAERAQAEAEANSFKASTKTCAERNIKLVQIGRELVDRLGNVHFGDILLAQEPLTGLKRVQVQNLLQDYQDKILEQKVQP